MTSYPGHIKAALEKATDRKAFEAQQLKWLREKRNICKDQDCLAAVYRPRIGSLIITESASTADSQQIKWHIIEGGPNKLCNQIYDLVANKGQATALRQSVEPLLKIRGVSLPEKEGLSGEDYYYFSRIAKSREQAAEFVKQVHAKIPETHWVRIRVNYDNYGEDEFLLQEETLGSLNDPTYSILDSNMELIEGNQNNHARIFMLNGEVFLLSTGENYIAVNSSRYISLAKTPISNSIYCNIEKVKK